RRTSARRSAHCPRRHASFFLLPPRPPTPTLFPYTTLFRSGTLNRYRIHTKTNHNPSNKKCQYDIDKNYLCYCSKRVCLAPYLKGDRKSTTSELQSRFDLVCRLLLEKKKQTCTIDGLLHRSA